MYLYNFWAVEIVAKYHFKTIGSEILLQNELGTLTTEPFMIWYSPDFAQNTELQMT